MKHETVKVVFADTEERLMLDNESIDDVDDALQLN